MKEITAVLLCLLAVCVFASALALDAEQVAGTWYLTQVEMGGEKLLPDEVGVDISIELLEDGKANLISAGNATAGTWSVDGEKVIVADPGNNLIVFTGDGHQLSTVIGDTPMVFGRESVRHERPVAVVAESAEEFYGYWESKYYFTATKFVEMDTLGIALQIHIDEEGITDMLDTQSLPYPCVIASGCLVGLDMTGSPAMVICRNEDGTITMLGSDGSISFVRMEDGN